MYLVADSDWGSLLGDLFLRLAMTEYALGRAAAMTTVSLSEGTIRVPLVGHVPS